MSEFSEKIVSDDIAYTRGIAAPEYLSDLDRYERVYVRYPSSQILLNVFGLTNVHVLGPRYQDYKSNPIKAKAVIGSNHEDLARTALKEYGVLLESYPSVEYLPSRDKDGMVFISSNGYGEQPISVIEECLVRGWTPACRQGIVNYYPGVVHMVDFEGFLSL